MILFACACAFSIAADTAELDLVTLSSSSLASESMLLLDGTTRSKPSNLLSNSVRLTGELANFFFTSADDSDPNFPGKWMLSSIPGERGGDDSGDDDKEVLI